MLEGDEAEWQLSTIVARDRRRRCIRLAIVEDAGTPSSRWLMLNERPVMLFLAPESGCNRSEKSRSRRKSFDCDDDSVKAAVAGWRGGLSGRHWYMQRLLNAVQQHWHWA